MKKLKTWSIMLLMVTLLPLVVSCSSDDDVDVNSYLIGKWHSSYAEVFGNGQSKKMNITKTGEYASAYYEFTFLNDGTMIFQFWQQDSNGLSQWREEAGSYYINGDIVRVVDSDGEVMDLLFDKSKRTLCIHASSTVDGILITVNVYLKK